MSNISSISRPSLAFIKVVEAIGILLRIPVSTKKSVYKAPVPSNYDNTVAYLENDFYAVLNQLNVLQSSGIPNDIASEFFAKTQEPGFDYEAAVTSGGLSCRELFNSLILLIQTLQNDKSRVPVKNRNVLLIFDGSIASYAALDCLSHIHNHGMLTILSVKDYSRTEDNYKPLADHSPADLQRRCEHQYKKSSHQVNIINIYDKLIDNQENDRGKGNNLVTESILQYIKESDSDVIIMGKDTSKYEEDEISRLVNILPDCTDKTVILAKNSSKVMPFSLAVMSRRFLICLKASDDARDMFCKSLAMLRPNDVICVLCVHESSQPKGDYRDTRFLLGKRHPWVSGDSEKDVAYNSPGWNTKALADLRVFLYEMIASAQVAGDIRIEEETSNITVGQQICKIAVEEQADFLVFRRGYEREVTNQCIDESSASVILLENAIGES